MQLHREGRATVTIFITLTIVALLLAYLSNVLFAIMAIVLALLLIFVAYFFRTSRRHAPHDALTISSPCDGTVVTVERVREPEIFENQERLQISVFMSVWNVHMNWYPCSGTVSYSRHHKGKYLVAWLPKSSTENERSSVVITHTSGERILIRQVAGAVARRDGWTRTGIYKIWFPRRCLPSPRCRGFSQRGRSSTGSGNGPGSA